MMLENKLNIKDPAELTREEERISKRKALELFELSEKHFEEDLLC